MPISAKSLVDSFIGGTVSSGKHCGSVEPLACITLLIPTIVRLLPLDERRYNLEMAKIDADKRIKVLEERVQKREKELHTQQVVFGRGSKIGSQKTQ